MKTYVVRFFEPTVYEVEAENEEQAKKQAVELWKRDHNTWIKPEVQVKKK